MPDTLLVKPEDKEIRAKYKIEIRFGKDRSTSVLKPSTGVLTVWVSGKRFHGGGDEQVYFCGYSDCGKPIERDIMSVGAVLCPRCKRESFTSQDSKLYHINEVRQQGSPTAPFEAMAISFTERYFKLGPPKIADLIFSVWSDLGGNADVYLKYHPLDIRYDAKHETTKIPDMLDAARMRVTKVIYPLARIIKDTSAGAEPRDRFLAMLTA